METLSVLAGITALLASLGAWKHTFIADASRRFPSVFT